MIIVLRPGATKKQVDHIVERVKKLGLKPWVSKGVERTIIGVIGEEDVIRVQPLEVFPGVEKVLSILKPYKLASRDFKKEDTVVDIGRGVKVGAKVVDPEVKADKVRSIRYKAKKRVHTERGHRQKHTRIEITSIK